MPVTSGDKKMGMRHLKMTIALEKRKIADHEKAAKQARSGNQLYSAAYHDAHAKEHKKDIKDRQKAYKKYSKAKMKAVKKNG